MSRKRTRQRQFSAIRKDHSKSVMSISNRSFHQHPINSRLQRQDSKQSSRASQHSRWLCVGCYNHKLCSDRKTRRQQQRSRQKTQQKLNLSLLDNPHDNLVAQTEHLRQTQNVNEFNLQKIHENQLKKDQKHRQHQHQIQEARYEEQERLRQIKDRQKQQHLRRSQFRKDLEKQIENARSKKRRTQEQMKQQPVEPIIEDIVNKNQMRIHVQSQYRNSLLRQIRVNQQKKRRQKQQQEDVIKDNEFRAVTFAMNRQRQSQEQMERQKKIINQDAKRRQEIHQRKKEDEERVRHREEQFRKTEAEQNRVAQQRLQGQRREQIDHYLNGLKKQMEINRRKRQQELAWMHKPVSTSIAMEKQQIDKKNCTDCKHSYPKDYLTKVG